MLLFFSFLPDVICLSKTKIKNSILANLDLPGYEPILHADANTNAGGVGVFVAQNLEAAVLGKMINHAFILDVIYRHPCGDVNGFISVLNQKIASFGPKQKCYFLGDLNINVDPIKSTQSVTDYMHMLSNNNCLMLIDKSARKEIILIPLSAK